MTLSQPAPDLNILLDEYATLRDTIQGLEVRREELGLLLKTALLSGQSAQTTHYRAALKRSHVTEYPIDRFRETFGDAAALEVSTISKKLADARAESGDLDAAQLAALAVTRERTPALTLVSVS